MPDAAVSTRLKFPVVIMLRTPTEFVPDIKAVLRGDETVSDFIRLSSRREIERRKREQQATQLGRQ